HWPSGSRGASPATRPWPRPKSRRRRCSPSACPSKRRSRSTSRLTAGQWGAKTPGRGRAPAWESALRYIGADSKSTAVYMSTETDLNGKAAVVTGGGRGLGLAVSKALAKAGAAVVVNDVDEQAAQEAVEAIHADGGRAVAEVVAIGSSQAAQRC